MRSPLLALNDAQIARLKSATSYKVFEDLPEREDFPYIVMGETECRDWSDKFKPGMEVFSTFHLWSQYQGRKEICEMADAVLLALKGARLDLGQAFNAVLDRLDSLNIIIDIDGVTRHGILRLRYLIEEV